MKTYTLILLKSYTQFHTKYKPLVISTLIDSIKIKGSFFFRSFLLFSDNYIFNNQHLENKPTSVFNSFIIIDYLWTSSLLIQLYMHSVEEILSFFLSLYFLDSTAFTEIFLILAIFLVSKFNLIRAQNSKS